MEHQEYPRLRNVNKVTPPFPLNTFQNDFGITLGKEIIYLLATKGKPILEGQEWEEIFANCIGAKWKPSNVGLDDVILDSCAWGAKTVKSPNPSRQKIVRLISGRNSPVFSYNVTTITGVDPNNLGEQVLSIWNERVSAIRKVYKFVRTVVLIKSNDLSEVVVFEFDTERYDPELFAWRWNERNNLEGYDKNNKQHRFSWQPHGSQFTILEPVPNNSLLIKITLPKKLDKENVLKTIGFDQNWIQVIKNHD
ncbi:MAG: hypothetical protein AB1454_06875 [Candidatus Auribacterota bacterium]